MTIYGIKTCSTVSKARKFMKERDIAFDFIDYKVTSVNEDKIRYWLTKVEMKILFNTRGTKYRELGLKAMNLDDEEKIAWMAKENYLLKRPIVEYGEGNVLVAYKEEIYQKTFDNY